MEKISPEVKGQLPKTGPGYAHDNLPLEFEPPTLPDLEADAVIRAATLPLFLSFL
jgi:hypothetical protein